MNNKSHTEIYSAAKYFDIANSYKDMKAEGDFFEQVMRNFAAHLNSMTFIEFAAGPANNCVEMAKRGWKSTAVDISPDMQAYGLEKAKSENVNIEYFCADMRSFQSDKKCDMAAILTDSIPYMLTNDDVINHLRSVASCLNDGGLYVLEMAHPKETWRIAKLTAHEWEEERDGCKVKIKWGTDHDVFDPIAQIHEVPVELYYNDNGKEGTITETAGQRSFTATEFDALVRASGVFEIVKVYGDLKTSVDFTNEKNSWRMVPVLRKQ